MKKPVLAILVVATLGAVVAGVLLLPSIWLPPDRWGPPSGPWRYGFQERLLPFEELPPTVRENLERLDAPERERALEYLRRLRPGPRREALRDLGGCPAAEFRERLWGLMGEPPSPRFPWSLVLLFLGAVGLALTLYLGVRKAAREVRLERCPHCGRPVEAGWRFCPYCTDSLKGEGDEDRERQ